MNRLGFERFCGGGRLSLAIVPYQFTGMQSFSSRVYSFTFLLIPIFCRCFFSLSLRVFFLWLFRGLKLKDEIIVARPRPGRNAAKNRQPIVDVDSDDDEMDEDHDKE